MPENQEPKKDYLMDDQETKFDKKPQLEDTAYKGSQQLKDKVALITGGDSGIGAATALLFAKEGADIVLVHYESDQDAKRTADRIEELGRKVVVLSGDVGTEEFAEKIAAKVKEKFGHIDVLVNNAGEQHVHEHFLDIPAAEITRTFQTNIIGMFLLTQKILPLINDHGAIINTSSITAYKGNPLLIDYSSTKGAIVSFTRSLSQNQDILDRKIRVNSVAPGPVWTPLIPATFNEEQLKNWGKGNSMQRAGQPYELAPSYLFLATKASQFIAGQTIHVNGGTVLNG